MPLLAMVQAVEEAPRAGLSLGKMMPASRPSLPPGKAGCAYRQTDWCDLWLVQHTCSRAGVNGTLQGAPIE